MMNHYFNSFQELLLAETPNYSIVQHRLTEEQLRLSGVELAQCHVLLRATKVWRAFRKNQAGNGW